MTQLLLLSLLAWQPAEAGIYNQRGAEFFRQGRIAESIAAFDRAIRIDPRLEPHHWQRGISFYYAGRYEDGRKQFELHQTVNPNDVENAVWRYLCMARAGKLREARESLLPIEHDARVPMMRIYALYRGAGSIEQVLEAAGTAREALFYAHLYIGLYHEAAGNPRAARENMALAAGRYSADHYMGDVARVHMKVRGWR